MKSMKRLTVFAPMTLRQFVWGSVLAILLGITLVIPAQADVVYTNFGTGICGGDAACNGFNGIDQNYDTVGGLTNAFVPGDIEMIANAFTSPGNFTLSDVQLVLQNQSNVVGSDLGSADVYLTADSGGVPGGVLESWLGVVGEAYVFPQLNAITLNSLLFPSLSNGTQYWLVVGPTTTTSAVAWNYSYNVNLGPLKANVTDGGAGIPTLAGPWSTETGLLMNAFQIDGTANNGEGTAVPEPATMLLLGSGLIGLAGYGRKKFFKK